MLENIFNNYEAFYTMLTSTVLMSNTPSGSFVEDCDKIIEFIGNAYCLDESVVCECKESIYKSLAPISLIVDKNAVFNGRNFGDVLSDKDVLNDIKCDVIASLERISKSNIPCINPDWFDYNHYFSYNACVRHEEIKQASSSGNVIANRQIGVLLALGIGAEANLKESCNRFLRGALWGDIPSLKLLAHTLKLNGNEKEAKTFSETAELADKYLHSGYTVVPKEEKTNYSEEAVTYYVYISSILQDIVYAYNKQNIDYSFIEALLTEELDYYKRMHFINNYERKEWKDLTNSAHNPSKKIGFR